MLATLTFVAVVAFSKSQNVTISSSGILPTISALLSPGVSGLQRRWRKSKLFIAWMLACLVVSNLYSGEMTSQIISPVPDQAFESISDIERHNYTLAFNNIIALDMINATVTSLSTKAFVSRQASSLKKVMETKGVQVFKNDKDFFQRLTQTGSSKVASVFLWPFAMWAVSQANKLTKKRFPIKSKCYLGKEVIPSGEIYYGFTPPGSTQMGRAFQKLKSAGIVQLWEWEFFAMAFSNRVQDRRRFASPTKYVDAEAVRIVALTMSGKMVTIFLIWALGIASCVFGFFCEFWMKSLLMIFCWWRLRV